jgi:hypothetical protein
MKNRTNLIIDLGILAAFLVAMEPRITGEDIHEWFSVALGATVIVHLLLHWDWIICVGRTYFARLWHSSRLNFFLDVLLFLGFNTIMFSGLMISRSVLPSLGITVGETGTWRIIHSQSAEISMWLVAIHFGLHWRWVVTMLKKYILNPIGSIFHKKAELEPVPVKIDDQE